MCEPAASKMLHMRLPIRRSLSIAFLTPFCAQPSVSVMIAVFLAALEYQVGNHIFQVASIQAT
ncbi:hypothetical protein HMPREF2796_02185 [Eikenella sp. HMSC071B05]|nr:hypothetical protein A7P92_05615 [Eikenella corrodens]OFK89971.1 hypothetical protein HMPREF2796_02185 [Eikenella sp. HMSC071B05]